MADPVLFLFLLSEELNDKTSGKVHTKSEIASKVFALICRQTAKLRVFCSS